MKRSRIYFLFAIICFGVFIYLDPMITRYAWISFFIGQWFNINSKMSYDDWRKEQEKNE